MRATIQQHIEMLTNYLDQIADGLCQGKGRVINITITLDPSKLAGSSQEYIASTIVHEGFHAIVAHLTGNNLSTDDEHVALFTNYLDLVAGGLQTAYPNMSLGDAKALVLKGALALEQSGIWPSNFVDKILNYSSYTRSRLASVISKYKSLISGTACN